MIDTNNDTAVSFGAHRRHKTAGHELPPVDKATVAGDFSTTGRSTNADPPELALAAKDGHPSPCCASSIRPVGCKLDLRLRSEPAMR